MSKQSGGKQPLKPTDPSKMKVSGANYELIAQTAQAKKKAFASLVQQLAKKTISTGDALRAKDFPKAGPLFAELADLIGPLVEMDPTNQTFKSAIAFIADLLSVPPPQRTALATTANYNEKVKLTATKILKSIQQNANRNDKAISGILRSQLIDLYKSVSSLKLEALKKLKAMPIQVKDIYKVSQQLKKGGLPQFSIRGNYQYTNPALMKFQDFDQNKLSQLQKNVYNTLQIPVKNHLQSYPQWIINRNEKRSSSNAPDFDLINRRLKNPTDESFVALQKQDNSLAYFDGVQEMWKGRAVDKLMQKQSRVQNFSKRFATNSFLYDTKLTKEQLDVQVPLVVQDIVAANTNLSTSGFGPVNSNSLALYAGRWMDTTTGQVRVLPNASSKFLNPLSSKQRLGYLQARILNHWNNLVRTAEQYNNLNNATAQGKYQKSARASLQRGFDPKYYKDIASSMIQSTIDAYLVDYQFANDIPYALTPMNKGKKVLLDAVGIEELKKIRLLPDKQQNARWKLVLQKAYDRTMVVLGTRVSGTRQGLRAMSQITSAYLSLVDTFTRKVKSSIKRFIKSKVIPQSINQVNILNTVQNFEQADRAADLWLNDSRLKPTDTKKFIDSLRTSLVGDVNAFKNIGVIPQATTATYGGLIRGLDQNGPQQIKKGVKYLGYMGSVKPVQGYQKDRIYQQLDGLNQNPVDPLKSYANIDDDGEQYKAFDQA